MWGMDCYTRVAIDAALERAKAFAGSDAAARDRREVFFQKLLMPAVHTMGADGWDLAAAVRKVRSNALHPPRETSSSWSGRPRSRESVEAVVGGCDAILRAIEEVDEAGLETTPPPRPAKGSGAHGVPERTGGKKKNGGGREPLDSNAPGFIPPGLKVKCKKPLGPYMIFAGEARGAILAETPSLTLPETAKALGRRWKKLAPEERARYEALAKAAKARYEEVDLPAAIQAALDGEVAAAKAEAAAEAEAERRDREEAAAREEEKRAVSRRREERARRRAEEPLEDPGEEDPGEDPVVSSFDQHRGPASGAGAGEEEGGREPSSDSEAYESADARRRLRRRAAKRRHFRLHPKGVGIVCVRPEGIEPGTYVQDYLGELYSPWRWFERQDAIKKREPGKALPDFFNITLERPAADAAGCDVLYVEAAHRCTFASRLSHSCAPNVQTVVVAVPAPEKKSSSRDDERDAAASDEKDDAPASTQLTIAQYATRRIEPGEELCWNYSCVTESEKEYRSAICLCSSSRCKGAFLDYAGSGAFTAVLSSSHDFLARNAILARACAEPVTEADRSALRAAGIKSAALTMPGSTPPALCPEWLVKWAALTLEYVTRERAALPEALTRAPVDGVKYDLPYAEATAHGVAATRIQNLVVTLDKIKYVLSRPGQTREPCMRRLAEEETIAHLWDGEHGVMRRCAEAFADAERVTKKAEAKAREAVRNEPFEQTSLPAGVTPGACVAARLRDALDENARPESAEAARRRLEEASEWVRSAGARHAALADAALMYARTERWVTPARYEGFESEPVQLVPLPKDRDWRASEKEKEDAMEKEDPKEDAKEDAKASEDENTAAMETESDTADVAANVAPNVAANATDAAAANGSVKLERDAAFSNGAHLVGGGPDASEADASEAKRAPGAFPRAPLANGKRSANGAGDPGGGGGRRDAVPQKLAARFKGDPANALRKKYQPHFAWGQLVGWFKQTVYDPSASLSAERRGSMSLPDPESAYAGGGGAQKSADAYSKKERGALLNHLAKQPEKQWPTSWRWSFRNPGKVYGSPWLDDAIARSAGADARATAQVLEALRAERGRAKE